VNTSKVMSIVQAKNAASIELNPRCSALVVVDMQRYFTQASYPFTEIFEKLSPAPQMDTSRGSEKL